MPSTWWVPPSRWTHSARSWRAAAILDGYNACLVQPNPFFAGELNYLPNELLKLGVTDIKQPFPEETVTLNGEDITPMVREAWDWLIAHSFAM